MKLKAFKIKKGNKNNVFCVILQSSVSASSYRIIVSNRGYSQNGWYRKDLQNCLEGCSDHGKSHQKNFTAKFYDIKASTNRILKDGLNNNNE